MDSTSQNDLSASWLSLLREEFQSERITDEEMCAVMRQIRSEYQYMTDPHTAVAFAAAQKVGCFPGAKSNNPAVLLSTASPCKFEEAVTVAIGADGWKEYYDKEFPERGKAILEVDEIEPVLYKAVEGAPLEKSQEAWEAQAGEIVANFGKVAR